MFLIFTLVARKCRAAYNRRRRRCVSPYTSNTPNTKDIYLLFVDISKSHPKEQDTHKGYHPLASGNKNLYALTNPFEYTSLLVLVYNTRRESNNGFGVKCTLYGCTKQFFNQIPLVVPVSISIEIYGTLRSIRFFFFTIYIPVLDNIFFSFVIK